MIDERLILSTMGLVCSLGVEGDVVWTTLMDGSTSALVEDSDLWPGRRVLVGRVPGPLPEIPASLSRFRCRNNQLTLSALKQMEPATTAAVARHGPSRIGVVMGSSTSGIAETELAYAHWLDRGTLPEQFNYAQHEMGSVAEFVAEFLGLTGPTFSISTACSSGAKAFASAKMLLKSGTCDAVLVGGADSLCRMTVQGFGALASLSGSPANPLSRHRNGLNVGEGAAVFLLERGSGGIALHGVGESSDAYHLSAPDPEGNGARIAMESALTDAGMSAEQLTYINLHGTGTIQNDRMEAKAVATLGLTIPVSSTKGFHGHALGAAGAIEVGLCWLALAHGQGKRVPLLPHLWDGQRDPDLPPLRVAGRGEWVVPPGGKARFLSNSFAFGGNNAAVIIGRDL